MGSFVDTVLVDLVGGLSWGSCAPHAQANTNSWDLCGVVVLCFSQFGQQLFVLNEPQTLQP